MKKATNVIMESTWQKDGKTCKVCSEKAIVNNGYKALPSRRGTFTFKGCNPFPCYSMESTYESVSAWLLSNGWKRAARTTSITIFYDVIDDNTGEVLCETTDNYYYH